MKTCLYSGRTYQEGVRVCPACGLNLEQAPENIMGAIEIDVEPEEWIAPHQQTQQTKTQHIRQEQEAPLPLREEPQPARQVSDEPERGAAETLSPERMRMFRGNQYFYVFRMLLLTVIGLCFFINNWLHNSDDIMNFISISVVTVVPGLLGGLWGLWRSLGRLRKTPGELAKQISTSPHGASSLFSAHERIVLGAPILGILLSAGALYAAYLILSNAPLKRIAYNLSVLGRIGSREWWYVLDKAGAGIGCSSMLIFCLSYPIRTIRLFMLRGKVIKTP